MQKKGDILRMIGFSRIRYQPPHHRMPRQALLKHRRHHESYHRAAHSQHGCISQFY